MSFQTSTYYARFENGNFLFRIVQLSTRIRCKHLLKIQFWKQGPTLQIGRAGFYNNGSNQLKYRT